MKMIHGASWRASSNISRTFFSDSPDMPDTTEGADINMNGTPSSWIYSRKMHGPRHEAPVAEPQSLTVWSRDADATRFAARREYPAKTESEWPSRVCGEAPAGRIPEPDATIVGC